MTTKQKILKFLYPFIRKMGKGKNGKILSNDQSALPKESFYDLKVTLNNGKTIDFSDYQGKKILLVNTASDCGYTGQYAELQELHEKKGNQLSIIAFPANDFAKQEKGDDDQISQFCQINYGVTFPIAKKGSVIKNEEQQAIFQWLTNPEANGWNKHQPDWNFSKYLIDEKGKLSGYYGPSISPLEDDFIKAIEK